MKKLRFPFKGERSFFMRKMRSGIAAAAADGYRCPMVQSDSSSR